MRTIERELQATILNKLEPDKTIIISGPQGVGKTHFLKDLSHHYECICLYLNVEEKQIKKLLLERNPQKYRELINNKLILLLDNIHNISNTGEIIQSIKDAIPNLKIITTSTFKPSEEALQGLRSDYTLYPLTHRECQQANYGRSEMDHLEQRLIYGNYPKLFQLATTIEKQLYLNELFDIYLIRDILTTENKNKMKKIIHLLRLISYLIGQEIFYRELEKKLSMNRYTIEKHLHLLEELSIIHHLKGFKKNLKKEVSVNASWYFMDNGLRNAIVGNFNPLASRDDIEKLWKNYLIAERIKKQEYGTREVKNYFWRTYDQQEIDMVEEMDGQLSGYIFSWNNDKHKIPIAWRKAYPHAEVKFITPYNYLEWIH